MHRLPRISPDVPLQYKQWTIPAGVRETHTSDMSRESDSKMNTNHIVLFFLIGSSRHVCIHDALRLRGL